MAAFSSAFEQDFDVEDLARLELDEKTQQRSDSSHQRQVEATNVSGQLVLKLGETVDEDIAFVSWRTVRAYPHDFIGHTNRDKVVDRITVPFTKAYANVICGLILGVSFLQSHHRLPSMGLVGLETIQYST